MGIIQKSAAKVSFKDGVCSDAVSLSLQVRDEKIVALAIKTSPSSCSLLKNVCAAIRKQVLGKHIGDVYGIDAREFDQEAAPHHSATLVVHALREAILGYESKKAVASLQEATKMLPG